MKKRRGRIRKKTGNFAEDLAGLDLTRWQKKETTITSM